MAGLVARRGPSKGAVILSVIRTARDRVARSITNAAKSAAGTRPNAHARGSEFWLASVRRAPRLVRIKYDFARR